MLLYGYLKRRNKLSLLGINPMLTFLNIYTFEYIFLSYSYFKKSIPYGEQSDIICTVGKLPENIPKNRFKTTFPCKNYKLYTNTTFEGIAFSQFAYVSFD